MKQYENVNASIDMDQLKRDINHIRKMSEERKTISELITREINRISKQYNIPKKIIRKFFLQNNSLLEDKASEELWLPILEPLI